MIFILSVIIVLHTLFIFTSANLNCCLEKDVPARCANALCNPDVPPDDLARYSLFEGKRSCTKYLPEISKCLSDGRDSTACCIDDAPSAEDGACFGMCNGTMEFDPKLPISEFQSCFAVNADSMYSCFQSSYISSPSSPENLEIVSKSSESVSLRWSVPLKNERSVHIYKVHIIESREMNNYETIHDTKDLFLTVNNLNSTSSYSTFVVAHGSKYHRNPDYYKSTPSNIIHFTTTTNIAVFKRIVRSPKSANSTLLSCHLKVFFGSKAMIEWEKMTPFGIRSIEPSDGSRFKISTYSSDLTPKFLVSSLEIVNLQPSDFTTYRCHIKGANEEYGEIILTEYSYSDSQPSAKPPNSILECCSEGMYRSHCTTICRTGSYSHSVQLRPANFLPPSSCLSEFNILFKCTLSQMNSAACCIKEKVPYQCLGMCDSSYEIESSEIPSCLKYLSSIQKCQLQTRSVVPDAISYVEHTYDDDDQTHQLSWEKSEGAKVYHVYTRKSNSAWASEVIQSPNVIVSDADEVAIVAVNDYGVSSQSRLHYQNNDWIPSHH